MSSRKNLNEEKRTDVLTALLLGLLIVLAGVAFLAMASGGPTP